MMCFFLLCPAVEAQQTLGSIAGTVTDTSGNAVAGAQISLLDQQTGLKRTVVSNDHGGYSFYNLAIDRYTIKVKQMGYESSVVQDVAVQANRTVTLNPKLSIGNVTESVTVTGSSLLNATDTTNGYVLDSAQIENVPLATGSFTQLAVLAPGVSAELLSGTGTQTGLGNQPIWANGQRDTSNTFLFNGVDTSNLFNGKSTSQVSSGRVVPNTGEGGGRSNGGAYTTNTSVYDAIGESIPTPAPEMIQEIRVNTSMYDAQQGSTSGAHIDLSTQAGTNSIHGQAYLYRATDWINSAYFFYKQYAAAGDFPENQVNPQLHRFTAGGTVGGPLIKNKLFGFIGYNAIRVSDQSQGISIVDLPYNQTTGATLTDDRSSGTLAALAGINPSQVNPAALALLQYKLPSGAYLIPSAQSIVAPITSTSGGTTSTSLGYGVATVLGRPYFSADQAVADLDWNVTPHDVLSAKYFYQHDPAVSPYTASKVSGFNQELDAGAHVASIVNALTPSSRVNWTQVLGYAREKAYSYDQQALSPQQAGINLFGGTTFPGLYVRDFSGNNQALNLGNTGSFNDTGVFQNRIAPYSDVIISLGKNTLSAGANYSYTQLDVRNRRTNAANLQLTGFNGFLEGNVDNTTNSELLLGASSRYYRSNQVGSYVQDKFQATAHLSLTAGLRYDWDGPLTEKYGNLFNFDPARYAYNAAADAITNDGFIVAGNNKLFATPGVSNSTLNGRQWGVAPRLGFAYSPEQFHDKVVVRGGFGIYYDRGEYFTYLSPGAGSGISGPFGVTQEPPLVVPTEAAKGANLSNPFGTTKPAPPTGNPASFITNLPNAASIESGTTTYPFGAYDVNNKLPYTENFAFDVQYAPFKDVAIDIGYVGNSGRHGVIPVPFNQPGIATAANPIHGQTYSYGQQAVDTNGNPLTTEPYSTADGGNTDLRVPYLGYSINSVDYLAAGVSSYNALQFHIEKRMSHDLQLGLSYTWSHSLDEQSGLGLFYNGNNPLNLQSGYGDSDFDRTHITNFIYTYQFPKLHIDNKIVAGFTNGWQLSGLTVLQSGQPFSVTDYTGTIGSIYYGPGNDGITNPIIPLAPGFTPKTARTGRSGGFVGQGGNGPAPNLNDLYFNYNAFNVSTLAPGTNGVPSCGVSTAGAPVCDVVETGFAPGGRNIFRQAFQKRADISLIKDTRLTERVSARYTFDVYNLTNSSSFDIPGNNIGLGAGNSQVTYDPTMSTAKNIAQQYAPLGSAGDAYSQGLGVVTNTIGGPRQIQMSLHILY